MTNKYYSIKKQNLAQALNFMGFKFYVYNGTDGKPLFGFEDTQDFRIAMNSLLQLRKDLQK